MSCQRFGFARARRLQGLVGRAVGHVTGSRARGLVCPAKIFGEDSGCSCTFWAAAPAVQGVLIWNLGRSLGSLRPICSWLRRCIWSRIGGLLGVFLLVFAVGCREVQHGRLSSQRLCSKAAAQVQVGRQRMLVKSFKLRVLRAFLTKNWCVWNLTWGVSINMLFQY